jgi:GNAT superfamily N-acetyltransferase
LDLRATHDALLARIEDAALTASQPSEQAFHDGWLLRYANGKAKRARSVNLVGPGCLPLSAKLDFCAAFYAQRRLPLLFRLTPFSQPAGVDDALAQRGLLAFEETRVMVLPLAERARVAPPQVDLVELDAARFGDTLGALHGLDASRTAVERHRFARSAVDGIYLAVRDGERLVACGSAAIDGSLVGIFGMVTAAAQRGRGLATALLTALLERSHARGATIAYLQVDATNTPARCAYTRFGFVDRYAYWYRMPASGENA